MTEPQSLEPQSFEPQSFEPQSLEPQWTPSAEDIESARITDFARAAERRHQLTLPDYASLWEWSTGNLGDFWALVWDYFEIEAAETASAVLGRSDMPGAQWFPGARLNYVDQVKRHAGGSRAAIRYVGEDGTRTEMSWGELARQSAALARTLGGAGVVPGDRVVGYLPNIPEAVVAFLATATLGAVWSACGQDYSASAALDRLGQLEPKVLVAADGYSYGGRYHDKSDEVHALRAGLTSVELVVQVGAYTTEGSTDWVSATAGEYEWRCTAVPFDHPLWVVFSSGTTGLPKGIVHGHGGVLLEHLKAVALQSDIGADDTFFWYTSPSWMMWNFQVAGLLVGATIVCADGSPAFPTPDALWSIAAAEKVTFLGTSPGYVLSCIKADSHPAVDHDLSALRAIGITGSSLPASSSIWLADNAGHVPVFSISGGTDVVSAFAGGVRTVPVWPGELSAPFLGVALDAFDEQGRPVRGEVGELVVTSPMPSMPVRFWNDDDGSRYRDAYFGTFDGIWRHGDWITVTDRGSVLVHGRSDSTLNRNGIRMGSADIYQAVESLPEVVESLVLGVESEDGGYWMPLFVVLADGVELDDALRKRIAGAIRDHASPRHVPDEIIAAPGVPHTRTGKKLEVPIKRIFQGGDTARTLDRTAVDAPELVDWYIERGRDHGR